MRISTTTRPAAEVDGDVVVVLFFGDRLPFARHLRPGAEALVLREDGGQTWLEPRRTKAPRVLVVRVAGPPSAAAGECGAPSAQRDSVVWRRRQRLLGAAIERACDARALERVVLAPVPAIVDRRLVLEGMIRRAYATLEFTPDEQSSSVQQVVVCSGAESTAAVRAEVRKTVIDAEAVNLARHLADLPANVGTPEEIARRATASSQEVGLTTKVLDPRARRLRMNLVSAVGAGAEHDPKLLVLEHNAAKAKTLPTLAFVGKGVTHDTGGYNLKRGDRIHEMSYDKAGAAAVIGAMHAIARHDLPAHVVGIVPLVENAIGSQAYRPGDILEGPDDTTVFVESTDAEGRLVLADCLAYARRFRPDLVVDIATLTNAAHVALGDPYAALYTNDDWARDALLAAGETSGDRVWPMPVDDDHEAQLRHSRAHLRNVGGGGGAASFAAAFLRRFVRFPWAHIDMAGLGYTSLERPDMSPGATGFGTRLLLEIARRFAERHERGGAT